MVGLLAISYFVPQFISKLRFAANSPDPSPLGRPAEGPVTRAYAATSFTDTEAFAEIDGGAVDTQPELPKRKADKQSAAMVNDGRHKGDAACGP